MNKKEFFEKHGVKNYESIKEDLFGRLLEIIDDYEKSMEKFEISAETIVKYLKNADGVHSIKYRIKSPDSLVKKIIRKAEEGRVISLGNYKSEITDLIGIRILHLIKEDWRKVHFSLLTELGIGEFLEKPTVYYRTGDDLERFKGEDFDFQPKDSKYRSIHYLIPWSVISQSIPAEIQVRTVFEEAWGEIAHLIDYPIKNDNGLIVELLNIFSRLCGTADEMGSHLLKIHNSVKVENLQKEFEEEKIKEVEKIEEEEKPKEREKIKEEERKLGDLIKRRIKEKRKQNIPIPSRSSEKILTLMVKNINRQDNAITFDICLRNNFPSKPLEYAAGQYHLNFNTAIANGRKLSLEFLDSDLPQQLRSPSRSTAAGRLSFAPNIPSMVEGNIISEKLTTIARAKLKTDAYQFSMVPLNLEWRSGGTAPFTKISVFDENGMVVELPNSNIRFEVIQNGLLRPRLHR